MDNITIKIDPEGEAIAFIHDTPCNYDFVMSYQHIGQHGEASLAYMNNMCKYPSTPQHIIKAFALLKELKSIGYDIEGLSVEDNDNTLPWDGNW